MLAGHRDNRLIGMRLVATISQDAGALARVSIVWSKLPMMNATYALKPGLSGTAEILVGTRDTAPHVGSGKVKVLATPLIVAS